MSSQQENSEDLTESPSPSSPTPPGKFRSLKYYSVPNRLTLKEKKKQDYIPLFEEPAALKPSPTQPPWSSPSGNFPIGTPGNPPSKSTVRLPPPKPSKPKSSGGSPPSAWLPSSNKTIFAEYLDSRPGLLYRFEQQINEALVYVESSSVNYNAIEDKRVDLKLELAPALFLVGNQKALSKVEEILDEAKVWADSRKEVKTSVLTNLKIAQVMSVLDQKKKEEAEIITRKAFEKTYKAFLKKSYKEEGSKLHPETADLLLSTISETLARVATPICINQIEGVVNLIKDEDYQLRTIIDVASEFTGQFLQHRLLEVKPQVTSSPDKAKVIFNLGKESNQGSSVTWSGLVADLGKAWESKISEMQPSVYRPYAIGAISFLFEQEDDIEQMVERALHYCDKDFQDDKQKLNFIEFLGNRAVEAKNPTIIRKLWNASSALLKGLKVTGTTLFQLNAAAYYGQDVETSSILDRIDEGVVQLRTDVVKPVYKTLCQLGKFDQAEKVWRQLPPVLKTETLVESSTLILNNSSTNDTKSTKAIELFEQAIDEAGNIEDPVKFILTHALITTVGLRGRSMVLPTQEVSITSRELNTEANFRKSDLFTSGIIIIENHTTEIMSIEKALVSRNTHCKKDKSKLCAEGKRIGIEGKILQVGNNNPIQQSSVYSTVEPTDFIFNPQWQSVAQAYTEKRKMTQLHSQNEVSESRVETFTQPYSVQSQGQALQAMESYPPVSNLHHDVNTKSDFFQNTRQPNILDINMGKGQVQDISTNSSSSLSLLSHNVTNPIRSSNSNRLLDFKKDAFLQVNTASQNLSNASPTYSGKVRKNYSEHQQDEYQFNLSSQPLPVVYGKSVDETKWNSWDYHDRPTQLNVDLKWGKKEVISAELPLVTTQSNPLINQNQKWVQTEGRLRHKFMENSNQLFVESNVNTLGYSLIGINDRLKSLSSPYRESIDNVKIAPLATRNYTAFAPTIATTLPKLASSQTEQKAILQNWALGQVRQLMSR